MRTVQNFHSCCTVHKTEKITLARKPMIAKGAAVASRFYFTVATGTPGTDTLFLRNPVKVCSCSVACCVLVMYSSTGVVWHFLATRFICCNLLYYYCILASADHLKLCSLFFLALPPLSSYLASRQTGHDGLLENEILIDMNDVRRQSAPSCLP